CTQMVNARVQVGVRYPTIFHQRYSTCGFTATNHRFARKAVSKPATEYSMPPILFLRSAYIVVTGVNQLLDEVAGPAFHFFVNPGEVFADNAEADHQQTSDDKFQENHGSEPAHRTTRQFQVDRL